MKTLFLRDECWDTELYILCPATDKELDAFLLSEFQTKKNSEGPFDGRFVEIEENGVEIGAVIALEKWTGIPEDYAVLVHELFHAVSFFLRGRDIKISSKTEEVFSYFLDSLVRRAAIQLNKNHRNK